MYSAWLQSTGDLTPAPFACGLKSLNTFRSRAESMQSAASSHAGRRERVVSGSAANEAVAQGQAAAEEFGQTPAVCSAVQVRFWP